MSEDRNRAPDWRFDEIKPARDQHGLPGIAMRVSRTADDGLPTFMYLSKARRLRDELEAAIKAAERVETVESNPPAALYGNVE